VENAFNISASLNPEIWSFEPTQLKAVGKTNNYLLRIRGKALSSGLTNTEVMLNGTRCPVTFHNRSFIECKPPDIDPGHYQITVHVPGRGQASTNSSVCFILSVASITPTSGSFLGGTVVRITGDGFGDDSVVSNTSVSIGGFPCHVTTVNNTEIECITSCTGNTVYVDNNGRHSGKWIITES